MKQTMKTGNTETILFTVTDQMSAGFDEKVIHHVCSTWDLAHQFEIAARKALEPHLEEGEQGIGSGIVVDHLKPAPVGKNVAVEAVVTMVDQSTVVCSIEAKIGDIVVATGEQIQRIFPTETIDRIIENANK